mmetsp:Transcript_34173/g.95342  ORF Transcript_34173/g.95342 Transcript_34173/m.95342 type:complete len:165 (-) Transcript_34173:1634-2128(-)
MTRPISASAPLPTSRSWRARTASRSSTASACRPAASCAPRPTCWPASRCSSSNGNRPARSGGRLLGRLLALLGVVLLARLLGGLARGLGLDEAGGRRLGRVAVAAGLGGGGGEGNGEGGGGEQGFHAGSPENVYRLHRRAPPGAAQSAVMMSRCIGASWASMRF